MMGDNIGGTIVLIIVLALIMFAAYFTTKFLSAKANRINKCKYLDIKDRMFVGKDKQIVLVEAGEQLFLIGITNQSINLIGTLKKEEIASFKESMQENVSNPGFTGLLGKISGIVKNAGSAQEELRKARLKAKVEKEVKQNVRTNEEQDEIDKILYAMQQRKNRTPGNNNPKGDGK